MEIEVTNETITWHPVSEPPDADVAVLIYPGNDGEVSEGFLDGETWRDAMAWPRNPTHWAEMPKGPQA
jgi:hypothetical protein